MYKLRDYQQYSVKTSMIHLSKPNPKPFILVLATGAGKSLIIAEIARKLQGNVLVLAPSQELVQQDYDKFMNYEPDFKVGLYCAALKRKDRGRVTFGTIQSIYKHPELFEDVESVLLDECHLLDPKNMNGMLKTFLDKIGCRKVAGLTATPYRMQQKFFWEDGQKFYSSELKLINRIFPFYWRDIVVNIDMASLIKQGYLSPILYRNVEMGELSDLKLNSNGSEYTEQSLQQYWKNDIRLMKLCQVIKTIDEKCQRNLIFCSSLLQATRAREMLQEMGIRAEMVDGSTPKKDRERLVAEYRRGDFKHMLNVGVFTTGFDVPQLDCVTLARHTMSLALYYQMVGRGVRLDPARPDKKLRVYDLVRVVEKLGRVETITVQKEEGGFKDVVMSEIGEMTNVPLFKFAVNTK